VNYDRGRERMIRRQLAGRGISDNRVLEAMRTVPRERFVPAHLRADAYGDYPLAIGEEQTISQPYMVALMTQLLALKGQERVLEIGTGSGYQTAVVAELAEEVYTVERLASLSRQAEDILRELGYTNVFFRVADGTLGWPEHAPYDRVLVTAGAREIPPPLIDQLAKPGIMIAPVGTAYSQVIQVVNKDRDGRISVSPTERCVFVPLVGQYGWQESH